MKINSHILSQSKSCYCWSYINLQEIVIILKPVLEILLTLLKLREEIFWNIFHEKVYRSFPIYSFECFQREDVYDFFVPMTYSLILFYLNQYQISKFRRSLLHAVASFTWYPGTKNTSINFSHEILGSPTLCYQISNYLTNVMKREEKKVTAILSLL